MPLYLVQDSDRPIYVFASSMSDAVFKWQTAVAKENDDTVEGIGEPTGVTFLCSDYELIIDSDTVGVVDRK